jgi:uncharacterized protein YbaA (DUF1428 family)
MQVNALARATDEFPPRTASLDRQPYIADRYRRARRRTMSTANTADLYVDIYLLPVPEKNLEAYREQALTFGRVAKEHGALSYREFRGDDLGEGLKRRDGEVLTAAVAEFESRAHRDEVMDKVMKDPRVTELLDGEPLADMGEMRYGGFQTFVNP